MKSPSIFPIRLPAQRGEDLETETSKEVEDALDALLEESKAHIVDFLSDRENPGDKNTSGFVCFFGGLRGKAKVLVKRCRGHKMKGF